MSYLYTTLVQSWGCDVGDALSVGFQGECTMHEWLWRSWLREVGDGAYWLLLREVPSSALVSFAAASSSFTALSAAAFASDG